MSRSNDPLTDIELIEYLLTSNQGGQEMKGVIRPISRQINCPVCNKSFQHLPKLGYGCPICKTLPNRFRIDIHWNGKRYFICSDKQGQALDSYQRALNLLSKIQHEIDTHVFDPKDYIKSELEQFYFSKRIKTWIEDKENEMSKGNIAPSTLKTYKIYERNYFTSFFKEKDIREIRTFDIQQFYKFLPDSLSLKYQKCIIDCLENFFNSMLRLEYIQRKPVFPNIAVDEKTPVWTSREIQDRIISKIPENDSPIFYFLTRQGIRPGEARALKVKDIDLVKGVLIVSRTYSADVIRERTKSKKVMPRLINPELLPMLKQSCRNKLPEAFVFINPRTKRPYNDKTLNNVWNRACKAAEVEIELYNGTRHSVASIAASAGAPLQAIKAALGHTDIRTTLKYAMNDLASQMIVFEKANKGKVANLLTQE